MPFRRNHHFTGRKPQLDQLEKWLFIEDREKIAIFGLGGVGKTQIVLELIYRTRERHKNCSIIWIPVINTESLQQEYCNVARQLGIPEWEARKADIKNVVKEYLSNESAGQWLLVFDNADDINMWIREPSCLADSLPSSKKGCIIFTTRDRKTAVKLASRNLVEVPDMTEDMATQLLKQGLSNQDLANNEQDTKALLEQLACLPLAIVQAAAYINENNIATSEYLSLLADQEEEVIELLGKEFEDEWRYRTLKNPVAMTWLISFEQIRHRDPLAADYLSFIACIDPKDVPFSLLPAGPSRRFEIEAMGTLDAYSFITRRSEDLALDVHRLVHLAIRGWLEKEKALAQWTEKAVARLEEVIPVDENQNRSTWRKYLPHARNVLESDLINKDAANRIRLSWKFGLCLIHDGRFNEAAASLIGIVDTLKRAVGADHIATLHTMDGLALAYCRQDRWEEAEALLVQAMEGNIRVYGREHSGTLAVISHLATLYLNQSRSKEAKELVLQVVRTKRRVLGSKHPDTLNGLDDLADIYIKEGQWKVAKDIRVHIAETSKKVLGPEHIDTLSAISSLALTYSAKGRFEEAEELQSQVLETAKRVLGPEHRHTLSDLSNLAITYSRQGRWEEAEELETQVVETRKRVFGPEHPDTLSSMYKLAYIWGGQHRYSETFMLLKECVQLQTRVLGPEHSNTALSSKALREFKELMIPMYFRYLSSLGFSEEA